MLASRLFPAAPPRGLKPEALLIQISIITSFLYIKTFISEVIIAVVINIIVIKNNNMGHKDLWNSHPKEYGKGSRSWYVETFYISKV